MKKICLHFIPAILLIISATGCSQTDDLRLLQVNLQESLDSLIIKSGAPGATFSVDLPGIKKICLASGYSDIESKEPMSINSVMMAGSVGKTFVAATIMKLYEHGDVDLDLKIIDYVSEDWFSEVPNATKATLRMLLNHTSGIPRYVYKRKLWEDLSNNPDKVWTNRDRMSYIFGDTAMFAPGTGWAYSDINYLFLGMVIEKVTGRDYYDIIQEWFIEPYKLDYTVPSDKRVIEGLASGYTGMGEAFFLPNKMVTDGVFAFNPQMEWTGGGVATTSGDLARWAKILWGGKFLDQSTLNMLKTPAPFGTYLPERAGYGFGVFVGESDNVKYLGHTGFMPGFGTIVQYIPEYDFSIAAQFNSDEAPDGREQMEFINNVKKIIIDYLRSATQE